MFLSRQLASSRSCAYFRVFAHFAALNKQGKKFQNFRAFLFSIFFKQQLFIAFIKLQLFQFPCPRKEVIVPFLIDHFCFCFQLQGSLPHPFSECIFLLIVSQLGNSTSTSKSMQNRMCKLSFEERENEKKATFLSYVLQQHRNLPQNSDLLLQYRDSERDRSIHALSIYQCFLTFFDSRHPNFLTVQFGGTLSYNLPVDVKFIN